MDSGLQEPPTVGRPVSRGWLAGMEAPLPGGAPGAWWRTASAVAVAIIIGLGGLTLIGKAARPLGLLVFGIVIGEAMAPLVSLLARVLPRVLAVLLIYFSVIGLIVLVAWLSAPILAAQIGGFISQVPALLGTVDSWLRQRNLPTGPPLTIDSNLLGTLLGQLGSAASVLFRLPVDLATGLLEVGVVLFISLYWQIEAPGRRSFFLSLLPLRQRERTLRVAGLMGAAMGGYVRGVVFQATLVGVFIYVGMLVIGVPYPLMMGALAGLLEVVPTLGPVLASLPMVLSALAISPTRALIVVAYIIFMQQFETHVLVPQILRGQTRITALTVVVAIFTGGVLGGFLGVLIAVPLAAALRVLVDEVGAPALRRLTGAPPPAPPAPHKTEPPVPPA